MAVLCGAILLPAYPPTRLSAQVGHPTDQSPFHDVKRGANFVIGAGYLAGGRGALDVGPSNGRTAGIRYERPMSQALNIVGELGYAQTTRFVVDPTQNAGSRTSGPFDDPLVLVDVGISLNLTGAKSWHGFAPYLGVLVGAAISTSPPSDPSTYRFKTKAMLGPELGLRWYLARVLSIRADARLFYWRLSYPLTYKELSPDGTAVLPLSADENEWTVHPLVSFAVGWTF